MKNAYLHIEVFAKQGEAHWGVSKGDINKSQDNKQELMHKKERLRLFHITSIHWNGGRWYFWYNISDQETVSHSPQLDVIPCVESFVFMHKLNERIAKLEEIIVKIEEQEKKMLEKNRVTLEDDRRGQTWKYQAEVTPNVRRIDEQYRAESIRIKTFETETAVINANQTDKKNDFSRCRALLMGFKTRSQKIMKNWPLLTPWLL